MKLAALNEHASAARLRVDALEQELAAAYLKALRAAGRKAASRFRGVASLAAPALTAATDPKWLPPDPGQLLDQQQLAAQAKKNAAPVQERALRLAVPVGIAFDLEAPLARQFLGGLADRTNRILAGFSDEIGKAIGEAHDQGLSIPKAAQLIRDRVESASLVQATLLARSDLVSIANGGSLLAAQLVNEASVGAGEGAANFKTWLTAGDERVRDTHAEADGQTVPLDQPFDIGGESLMYPGDPDGSFEETLNCRCTTIYGDSMNASAVRAPTPALSSRGTMDETPEVTATNPLKAFERQIISRDVALKAMGFDEEPAPLVLRDFHLTAAAGEPTRWQATLLVEDEPTEDGRMIAADAATWRPLPLPLSILDDSSHSDTGDAPVCGRIDQIWRAGSLIQAAGVFDTGPIGVEAERLVTERMITGISCDGVCTASEIVVTRKDDAAEDQALEDEVDGVIGGDPVVDETYDDDLEYLFVATEYVIMGATICPAGAIAQARIDVVTAAIGDEETWNVHGRFEPSRCEVPAVGSVRDDRFEGIRVLAESLAASAAPPARDDTQHFEALTASVDALTSRTEAAEKVLGDRLSALETLAAKTAERERAIGEQLASAEARQGKILLQLAATTESFDAMAGTLGLLAPIQEELVDLRGLLERKPRQVEFKRDDKGRLAGLVEG